MKKKTFKCLSLISRPYLNFVDFERNCVEKSVPNKAIGARYEGIISNTCLFDLKVYLIQFAQRTLSCLKCMLLT